MERFNQGYPWRSRETAVPWPLSVSRTQRFPLTTTSSRRRTTPPSKPPGTGSGRSIRYTSGPRRPSATTRSRPARRSTARWWSGCSPKPRPPTSTMRSRPPPRRSTTGRRHRGGSGVAILDRVADLISERSVEHAADCRGRTARTGSRRLGEVEEAADLIRYYTHAMRRARRLRRGDATVQRGRGDERRDAAVRRLGGDRTVQLPERARRPVRRVRRSSPATPSLPSRRRSARLARTWSPGVRRRRRAPRCRQPRHRSGPIRQARRSSAHNRRRRADVHRVERRRDVDPLVVLVVAPEAGDLRDGWQEPGHRHRRRPISTSPSKARPGARSASAARSARRRHGCSSTRRSPTSSATASSPAPRPSRDEPARPGGFLSPVVDEAALDRYDAVVADAGRTGEVLTGGQRLTDGDLGAGNFVAPTVVRVPDDSPVWTTELFLPLIAVRAVARSTRRSSSPTPCRSGSPPDCSPRPRRDRSLLRPHRGRRHLRQPGGGRDDRRVARRAAVRRLEAHRAPPPSSAAGRTTCSSTCASSPAPSSQRAIVTAARVRPSQADDLVDRETLGDEAVCARSTTVSATNRALVDGLLGGVDDGGEDVVQSSRRREVELNRAGRPAWLTVGRRHGAEDVAAAVVGDRTRPGPARARRGGRHASSWRASSGMSVTTTPMQLPPVSSVGAAARRRRAARRRACHRCAAAGDHRSCTAAARRSCPGRRAPATPCRCRPCGPS